MPLIASLPMYDLPEIRQATDHWWRAIAEQIRLAGAFRNLPADLDRSRNRENQWRAPDLIMSQTCGYPLMREFHKHLRVLGAPRYDAQGCSGHDYRSAFVVRRSDRNRAFAEMAGRRLAVNGRDSHSGCNVIKARIGELRLATSARNPFFSSITETGQHRKSLALVISAGADIAAIDMVTLALLRRHAPQETKDLAIIDYSTNGPALPYVTANTRSPREIQQLRRAIAAAIEDPAMAGVRAELCIKGFDTVDVEEYHRINTITAQGREVFLSPGEP